MKFFKTVLTIFVAVLLVLFALSVVIKYKPSDSGKESVSESEQYSESKTSGGGEGGGDSSETVGEYYEVTVPALMNPGDSKTVSVTGYWAANRKLTVTADTKVTMTNTKDESTRDLNVAFDSISERGSNTTQMNLSSDISVQEMNDVIFGTWRGTITYTISVTNV